ncbi:hypothetical protein GCM10009119_23360 [Algoriphagus jejuensis]|uniref:Uncharacterized protein n=1 Tax=Algoriphagus jejuensis TaxID=419934 RepID=A0ABP3YFV4_9BACT
MRKTAFISILSLALTWACKEKREVGTEEIKVESPAVTPEIPDPDLTDQIPGDQYLKNTVSEETASLIRERLRALHADDLKSGFVDSLSRKFIFFEKDLNGDGSNEIFLGLTGPYFCGSGGCSQLILDSKGEVVTTFTVSNYPVYIANEKSNGWNDLFIYSGGAYRVVKFDGKSYPSNPSTLPKLGNDPDESLPRAMDFLKDNYPWFVF